MTGCGRFKKSHMTHMTSVKVIPTVLATVGYVAIQLISVKEGNKDLCACSFKLNKVSHECTV